LTGNEKEMKRKLKGNEKKLKGNERKLKKKKLKEIER